MLHAAQDVEEFAASMTFHQFEKSRLHQKATLKSIEIISEAATHTTEETRLTHPEIPWKKIISMRNRLVHGYFQVDLERVWNTVQRDIPSLVHTLELLVLPKRKNNLLSLLSQRSRQIETGFLPRR